MLGDSQPLSDSDSDDSTPGGSSTRVAMGLSSDRQASVGIVGSNVSISPSYIVNNSGMFA